MEDRKKEKKNLRKIQTNYEKLIMNPVHLRWKKAKTRKTRDIKSYS